MGPFASKSSQVHVLRAKGPGAAIHRDEVQNCESSCHIFPEPSSSNYMQLLMTALRRILVLLLVLVRSPRLSCNGIVIPAFWLEPAPSWVGNVQTMIAVGTCSFTCTEPVNATLHSQETLGLSMYAPTSTFSSNRLGPVNYDSILADHMGPEALSYKPPICA